MKIMSNDQLIRSEYATNKTESKDRGVGTGLGRVWQSVRSTGIIYVDKRYATGAPEGCIGSRGAGASGGERGAGKFSILASILEDFPNY